MATFNSIQAVINDISKKVEDGVLIAGENIIEDAQNRAGKFYSSFTPKVYKRSYGLSEISEIVFASGLGTAYMHLGYDNVDMTNPEENPYSDANYLWSDNDVMVYTMYGNHGDFWHAGYPDYIFYDNGLAYNDRMKFLHDGLVSAGLPLV